MAAYRQSVRAAQAAQAAKAAESDPLALTLLRSEELRRQRRANRLLAEVAALRKQNAALEEQSADLLQQLAETPDDGAMHATFAALGAQTVSRHLGVWVVSSEEGGGRRKVVVRLRPDDDQPAHMLQLEEDRQGVLTATVRDLPPGVRLDTHLEMHGTKEQLPDLVHAVAAEVDAFSWRRRQVEELRGALPRRRSDVWHDPACCDVRLQLLLSGSSGRLRVCLQMVYATGATLPHECRLLEAGHMVQDDREELAQTSRAFLRLPLREAFAEAFQ